MTLRWIPFNALTQVHDLLLDCDLYPQGLTYESHMSADPVIKITFATLAELEAWCKADKTKITTTCQAHLGHDEYSALYDKPGRRTLAICRVFDPQHTPHTCGIPKEETTVWVPETVIDDSEQVTA